MATNLKINLQRFISSARSNIMNPRESGILVKVKKMVEDKIVSSTSKRIETPPVIRRARLYYTVITWFALILFTINAVYTTATDPASDHDFSYLIPVTLYGLLLLFFPRLHYKKGQGFKWQPSVGLRRTATSLRRRGFFIALSFILIFWMNFNPNFIGMYFSLLGQSVGILEMRYSLPLVVIELLALLLQNGLLDPEHSRITEGGLFGVGLSVIFTIPTMVIITALTTSRLKSEQLVQELKETKRQLEEALLKEKELAVLRERDRMAREMHDVLGHALVLVAVKIEAAQRLHTVDPARATAELETTKELVRQSMTDLRASLADLRSPALEADGKPMALALKEWAEFTAREGKLILEANLEAGTENLPGPVQDALWRVGREAILNVVKHARAKKVELKVFFRDHTVFLAVGDDGVGIPHLADGKARLEVEGHYGVRGMRERLEALGGQLVFRPNHDGRGTLVTASVPLPPPSCQETPLQPGQNRFSLIKSWLGRGAD